MGKRWIFALFKLYSKAPVAKRYQDEFETTKTPYCPWCGFKMVGIGVE